MLDFPEQTMCMKSIVKYVFKCMLGFQKYYTSILTYNFVYKINFGTELILNSPK